MSLSTFRKAMALCADTDALVTLGGGEPTIHPQFETILLESVAACSQHNKPYIVTNGGIKKRAIMVAKLIQRKVINGQLSLDDYHDPIDDKVIEAFRKIGQDEYYSNSEPGIRNTTNGREPLAHGRAMTEVLGMDEDDIAGIERDGNSCMCEDYRITPNGDIVQCGCDDSPIVGNVDEGIDAPGSGYCCHSSWFASACTEEGHGGKYLHLLD